MSRAAYGELFHEMSVWHVEQLLVFFEIQTAGIKIERSSAVFEILLFAYCAIGNYVFIPAPIDYNFLEFIAF
ncbi:hypothetical protein T08_10145 [Trichinella sp. T8]|nr:hypothetical protein T08_10145 [Trichinella sp. T8]